MDKQMLLLGVDGGGTSCRLRLCVPLGRLRAGLGLGESFAAVIQATRECLQQASLTPDDTSRIVACLAPAGAGEPTVLAAAQRFPHRFRKVHITTNARAVVVVGTGHSRLR